MEQSAVGDHGGQSGDEDGDANDQRPDHREARATSTCASGPSSVARSSRSGIALELPVGAVVDLDRTADSPVDLFVNGLCFGHGHLLVTEDGEWAIEVQSLTSLRSASRRWWAAPASTANNRHHERKHI